MEAAGRGAARRERRHRRGRLLAGSRTAGQFAAIEAALGVDARVAGVSFEGREQAYERFRALWAREPDLVAAVSAGQFPESFRVRLAAGQYAAFRETYAVGDDFLDR